MKIAVDHFSIAVHTIDRALEFCSRYFPIEMNAEPQSGYNPEFRWCDFHMGHAKIELIESARAGSFVEHFLTKRGEGIHHLSLEVDDLEGVVEPMERDGLRIVDRFDAGDGHRTAFVSPRSAFGMLVQFWEVPHDPTAGRARERIVEMPIDGVRLAFDHLSVAVRDLDAGRTFFERYFPLQNLRDRHVGYAGDFELQQFDIGDYKMELIADASGESFVTRFLARRGEGFHHISIDVDRIDPVLEKMRSDGVRIVDEADVGNGYKTAFVSPRFAHGVLIQFWQVPELLPAQD